MTPVEPDLHALRAAVGAFGGYGGPDKSWTALARDTTPLLDPSLAPHRRALHTWLNAWGCRIRYPREGEPDVFGTGVSDWWERWHHALPAATTSMVDLADAELAQLGDCYAALAEVPATGARSARALGPTAAAKLLYALRPKALMPWDEAIAQRLHGKRDGAAYAAHQRLGRGWARRLLAEASTDEDSLCAMLGRPGRSLAKLLDEYCYIMFTRDGRSAIG